MKRRHVPTVAMIACVLAGLAGWVVTAQDKYTLKVPDGLALSEFKGYESWQGQGLRVHRVREAVSRDMPEPEVAAAGDLGCFRAAPDQTVACCVASMPGT
jgi:hypothetical protein